jgi:hypothetical protein
MVLLEKARGWSRKKILEEIARREDSIKSIESMNLERRVDYEKRGLRYDRTVWEQVYNQGIEIIRSEIDELKTLVHELPLKTKPKTKRRR